MNCYYPEGYLINQYENKLYFKSQAMLEEAMAEGRILEAKATLCDNQHNLWVDLGCMKGKISREEGAYGIIEGTVRDIALITRVNKPICFVVIGFETDSNGNMIATLSRRIPQIQCIEQYLQNLKPGDIIPAKITHLEPFGAFADVGCGIPSLIPIDAISVSRISHPRDRFSTGMKIKAIVKSVDDYGRISLSHKELLGTWEENARLFNSGETVTGIVRSVESYGIFVELTPNLAGLAEPKDDVYIGQQASVYIKTLIPERMKVKLIIIDTMNLPSVPESPQYFIDANHIDKWIYSPENCSKIIETDFNNINNDSI